jgi:anti-sigma regulatory factor (Ser/Thr protein kinase)
MSGSPLSPLDLDLAADLDGLAAGGVALERHCSNAGVPAAAIARILAVFEEIFTNTMKYGYRGRAGGRIRVQLGGGDPLRLILEDSAPPFDPTRWDSAPDLAGDVTARPVGRVGIALVMGLTRSARWQPLAPGNRLTLELSGGEGP